MDTSLVKVYIWMPSGNLKILGTGIGVGHSALKIPDTNTGGSYYITWMAHGDPLKALFPSQARNAYKKIDEYTYYDDRVGMRGFFGKEEPSYTIKIPTLRLPSPDEGLRFGVDISRIEQFWKNRLENRPKYAFLSKANNCTGCVVDALRAGGLHLYQESPNNLFVQDAATLLSWVKDAEARLDALNAEQSSLNKLMQSLKENDKSLPMQQRVIPPYEAWKTESDQKVSFRPIARRVEQVAALDKLIKAYHNTNDKFIRFMLLVKMQRVIYSHITNKPGSDRREAVRRLGVKVTTALEDLVNTGLDFSKLNDDSYCGVIWSIAMIAKQPEGYDDSY